MGNFTEGGKPLIINRTYLNTLSNAELLGMALDLALDFPDDGDRGVIFKEKALLGPDYAAKLNRKMLINEILDTLQELELLPAENAALNRGQFKPLISSSGSGYRDEAVYPANDDLEIENYKRIAELERIKLPSRYNRTYIHALVRDPFWVYVYWEIKKTERAQIEHWDGFSGCFIKIERQTGPVCCEKIMTAPPPLHEPFFVEVYEADSSRYIDFSHEEHIAGSRYTACLCVRIYNGYKILAVTLPFKLPRILANTDFDREGAATSPLARLSGIGEMALLRERKSEENLTR